MRNFGALDDDFDVVVIGGGASGLGAAVDAISRGYKTALVEAVDFAKATSSRSTKLIHGGVRYLAEGDIHLVREALRERAILRKNAPHLVQRSGVHLSGLPLVRSAVLFCRTDRLRSTRGAAQI